MPPCRPQFPKTRKGCVMSFKEIDIERHRRWQMYNYGLGLEWRQYSSVQRPQNSISLPLMNHSWGLFQLPSKDCTRIPTGQFILGQFGLKADPLGLLAATTTHMCHWEEQRGQHGDSHSHGQLVPTSPSQASCLRQWVPARLTHTLAPSATLHFPCPQGPSSLVWRDRCTSKA